MSKAGSTVKGAAGGAVAGSAFGPWGTAIGAGLGGVYGFLNDTSDEQAGAEKQKLAGMQKAAQVYEGYRPQATGARQQGLNQQLSAYNGAGNAMGLMYGSKYNPNSYAPDLGKLPTPSNYAPKEGTEQKTASSGAPIFSSADSMDYYKEQAAKEKTTPGDIIKNALIPGALVTEAIAGGPDPQNKELFNTSGLSQESVSDGAWIDDFRAKNGGAFPSDAEFAAYLESQGRAEEAATYRKRNRGRA